LVEIQRPRHAVKQDGGFIELLDNRWNLDLHLIAKAVAKSLLPVHGSSVERAKIAGAVE